MAWSAASLVIAWALVQSRALRATPIALRVVSAVAAAATAVTMTVETAARTVWWALHYAAL
jgi:hypothetical protein